MGFNRDDWDGPIPPEHHPMLSPEMRQKIGEHLHSTRLEESKKKGIQRRKATRILLSIFFIALGALICWTYGSESLSLMSTIWTSITNMI